MALAITNVELKAGQVAAALDLSLKTIQNTVDAGYVRPSVAGAGRGSTRLFSFADVVRLRVLDILVEAYGLERSRAARVLADAWDDRSLRRKQTLVVSLAGNTSDVGIKLEPIRLPLKQIVETTERRVGDMLATYTEGKRGRPVGWTKRAHETLATAAGYLRDVDDEQIARAIAESRATRRAHRKSVAAEVERKSASRER